MNDFKLLDSNKRRVQDSILQFTSSTYIKLDHQQRKENVHHLLEIVNFFKLKLKEDKLFEILFQKVHHTGSYWDGLKVCDPTEFDINFIYKLPFKPEEFLIKKAAPAYVLVNVQQGLQKLKQNRSSWEKFRKLEKWCDGEGNLIADNMRRWQESILEKVIAGLTNDSEGKVLMMDNGTSYLIKFRKAGPAITLIVKVASNGITFCVDVVPAFEFPVDLWPPFIRPCPKQCPMNNWHVVPKPYDPLHRSKIQVDNKLKPLCWRLSFHNIESWILQDSCHLKPTIKFLKKLRDVREQSLLHSYALKTIFLWKNDQEGSAYWKNDLSSLFLQELLKHLDAGKIPFFWDDGHNVLDIGELQMENLANNIRNTSQRIIDGLKGEDSLVIARELCNVEELQLVQEMLTIKTTSKGRLIVTLSKK